MRIRPVSYIALALGLLCALPLAAAPDIGPTQGKETLKSEPALNSVAPTITPHKAIYTIKMAGVKNGSRISDIGGRMLFSWADDCSAWNMEQKMYLRFYYSEGDTSDSLSDLISRESKDGASYNFHLRRNGEGKQVAEIFSGHANLASTPDAYGAGEAIFTGGKERKVDLKHALFPAHHTMELLANARAGKKFFSVNVFDGADESGVNEISAFIGDALDKGAEVKQAGEKKSGTLSENPLMQARAWPIRMAFFAPNSETSAPDYEMDMVMLDNGVIKAMTVDYGDFSMRAELVEVVPLPAACAAAPTPPPS